MLNLIQNLETSDLTDPAVFKVAMDVVNNVIDNDEDLEPTKPPVDNSTEEVQPTVEATQGQI